MGSSVLLPYSSELCGKFKSEKSKMFGEGFSSKLHVRRHALYVTKYHNNFHVCFLQSQIKVVEIKGNDLAIAIKYGTPKKLYF